MITTSLGVHNVSLSLIPNNELGVLTIDINVYAPSNYLGVLTTFPYYLLLIKNLVGTITSPISIGFLAYFLDFVLRSPF